MTKENKRFISYSQNNEDVILNRIWPEGPGYYIDLGCHHPIEDSVSYAFYKRNWTGINVDPIDEFNHLYRDFRQKDKILNNLVGEKNEIIDFYYFSKIGSSTVFEHKANDTKILTNKNFKKIKKEVVTLDYLVQSEKFLDKTINWLKIDCEGSELSILKGWNSNFFPIVILLENGSDDNEIYNILTKKNYIKCLNDGINTFYLHNNHLKLKKLLDHPVNYNDNFVNFDLYQAQFELENLKRDLVKKKNNSTVSSFFENFLQKKNIIYLFIKNFNLKQIFKIDIKYKIILLFVFLSKNNLIRFCLLKLLKLLLPRQKYATASALIETLRTPSHGKQYKNIDEEIKINNNHKKNLYFDVTDFINKKEITGIQRVVKNILNGFIYVNNYRQYNFELIVLKEDGFYKIKNLNFNSIEDDKFFSKKIILEKINEFNSADIIFFLDYNVKQVILNFKKLLFLKINKLKIFFCIYDILTLQYPDWFYKKNYNITKNYNLIIANFSGIFAISKTSRDRYLSFLYENKVIVDHNFSSKLIKIPTFNYNIENDQKINFSFKSQSAKINIRFLCVGTIEPRKGVDQLLRVFNNLTKIDNSIYLDIIGKKGWLVEELYSQLQKLNGNIFYHENISDAELLEYYCKSDCLVLFSYDEGFSMPSIEFAKVNNNSKFIIGRNIGIFREVLGEKGIFFPNSSDEQIIVFFENFIRNYRNNNIIPVPINQLLDIKECAQDLYDNF